VSSPSPPANTTRGSFISPRHSYASLLRRPLLRPRLRLQPASASVYRYVQSEGLKGCIREAICLPWQSQHGMVQGHPGLWERRRG
jgi:hypothetical protein